MPLLAHLHSDDRLANRYDVDAEATLRTTDDHPIDILVANLSSTGCLFVCSSLLHVDDVVTIGIAGFGRMRARIARAEQPRYGALFMTALAESEVSVRSVDPVSTVIPFSDANPFQPVIHEAPPLVAKLSGAARVAIIFGAAVASWAGVAGGVALLF